MKLLQQMNLRSLNGVCLQYCSASTTTFLWDEVGLKKLYRGDGYTYDDHGNKGNLEYLAFAKAMKGH